MTAGGPAGLLAGHQPSTTSPAWTARMARATVSWFSPTGATYPMTSRAASSPSVRVITRVARCWDARRPPAVAMFPSAWNGAVQHGDVAGLDKGPARHVRASRHATQQTEPRKDQRAGAL